MMTYREAFVIENKLLDEVSGAILSGRKFNEREQRFYDAFAAMQDLRKYLKGGGDGEGRQAEDMQPVAASIAGNQESA